MSSCSMDNCACNGKGYSLGDSRKQWVILMADVIRILEKKALSSTYNAQGIIKFVGEASCVGWSSC